MDLLEIAKGYRNIAKDVLKRDKYVAPVVFLIIIPNHLIKTLPTADK